MPSLQASSLLVHPTSWVINDNKSVCGAMQLIFILPGRSLMHSVSVMMEWLCFGSKNRAKGVEAIRLKSHLKIDNIWHQGYGEVSSSVSSHQEQYLQDLRSTAYPLSIET